MRRTRLTVIAVLVGLLGLPTVGTAGSAAGGEPLRLVALGDSLPYNPQDKCPGCTGYAVLYGKAASKALGVPVTVDNRSEYNSLTSPRLLNQVLHSAPLRAAIARADIVVLTIGHNETPWNITYDRCDGDTSKVSDDQVDWSKFTLACAAPLAQTLGTDITGILGQIRTLRAGKPTAIRVTNFYNDYVGDPGSPPTSWTYTRPIVDLYSKAICGAVAKAKLRCVDIYHALNGPGGTRFAGPFLAKDVTHLNQHGNDVVAALLTKSGYTPLHR